MDPKPLKEPTAAEKFRAFAQKVISVPKEEIERREAESKREREKRQPKAP